MILKLRQFLSFFATFGYTSLTASFHLKDTTLQELIALVFLMNNYRFHNDQTTLVCELIFDRFEQKMRIDKVLGFFPKTMPNIIQCLATQILMAEQEMEKDLAADGRTYPTDGELAMITNQFVSVFFKSEA
mgnify:CR=1 FL=1